MTKTPLTAAEEQFLWDEVRKNLTLLRTEPPASTAEADKLLALLPKRAQGESLRHWLERGQNIQTTHQPLLQKWIFLTEIVRLAAATTSDSPFPLPDPQRPLETQDGQFRFWISGQAGKILIKVETLGLAIDNFAFQRIGIADAANTLVAIIEIELDENGEGYCEVDDQPAIRQALLRPTILQLDEKT